MEVGRPLVEGALQRRGDEMVVGEGVAVEVEPPWVEGALLRRGDPMVVGEGVAVEVGRL